MLSQSEPDILEAVYDFVKEYSGLDKESIFQAKQNKAYLPKNQNNFAVLSLVETKNIGTRLHNLQSISPENLENVRPENLENVSPENLEIIDQLEICTLVEAEVQVDVYTETQARGRKIVQQLTSLFCEQIGYEFLQNYQISPLYYEKSQDQSQIDASKQYQHCFSCCLFLSYWSKLKQNVQTFSSVNPRIENIEVEHPVGNDPCVVPPQHADDHRSPLQNTKYQINN